MRPQAQPKICTVRQLTPMGTPPLPLTSGSGTPSKRSLTAAPSSRLALAGSPGKDASTVLTQPAVQADSSVPWERGSSPIPYADCSVSVFKKQPTPFQRIVATQFLRRLGPGLITGASDDDPSGIGTYSQAGAQLGYSIGWTMLLTYPLMVAIQEISASIGRTTGHGISGNLCRHYPSWLLQLIVTLLFIANTINIGADLSSMADAARVLFGGRSLLYVWPLQQFVSAESCSSSTNFT